MAELQNPRVTARPRGEALADLGEQLGGDLFVLETALDDPARVQIAAARERDEPLREGTQLLRLRLGRLDPAVPEEARRHVIQRRLLVARRSPPLAALGPVT